MKVCEICLILLNIMVLVSSCVHTQKKVVIQERIQTQKRSEDTSLTVLNWNGSENTFAVHTDIEPVRDRFGTVPRTVSGVV